MPLDGLFLTRLAKELNILVGGKISKVLEVSDTEYILSIRANYKNYNLFMSFSNEFSRIHLTNKKYEYPQTPKSFTMLLRKYLEGNVINSIETNQNDRVIVIDASGLNEIGDLEGKKIVIELMGKFSNLILVKNGVIIDALKKESSIEAKRIIFPNAAFEFDDSGKLNPYDYSEDEIRDIFSKRGIITSKDLSNTFNGISLLASSYIMNSKAPVIEMMNVLYKDITPISFNVKNKIDFYFTNIGFDTIKEYPTLSDMLDEIFFDLSLKDRIKQKTNDLALTVSNKISKLESKLVNLENDMKESEKSDIYRLYGELLIANSYITKKSDSISVINYYNNEEITIPLDVRYSIIDNSKLYYKKYQKAKNAKAHILLQMDIAKEEIEYLNIIKAQIRDANMSDIMEIKDELSRNKIISASQSRQKQRKVKTKILTFLLDDGKIVYVGKNNLQNEMITHKIAKSNSMWFHIKDAPGSHVVLLEPGEISEYDIRTCANIAAFFSTYRDSSSVPVDYTLVRNIKKIPGRRNCFVTFTNQKTIYIDPDKDLIDSLNQKNTEF